MRRKVALFGPKSWALANINYFLKKFLQKEFHVDIISWNDETWKKLIKRGGYDVIISEASAVSQVEFIDSKKLIPLWHSFASMPGKPIEDSIHTRDYSEYMGDSTQCYSITRQTSSGDFGVSGYYKKPSTVLPIGVDLGFWNKKSPPKKISSLGCVLDRRVLGNERYDWNKRPAMFYKICEASNCSLKILSGKSFMTGTYVYDGCDAVICTSLHEGNPMSLFECSASKIPFISTNCGLPKEYECVKKFNTVSEARDIIGWFNSDPRRIEDYVEELYQKVAIPRDWEKIVDLYWIPEIRKRIYENDTCLRL